MRSKQPQFEDLDHLDVKILSALCEDGRITSTALAERVGLSTSPCWTRVRRMEERGIIERYTAVLNHRELGFSNIVFVEITLDKHDEHVLERFGAALAEMPEVMEAYLVTGDYDYLVKLVVRDTDHYERFLRESLYRVPGIRQSRTTFGIRTLKRSLSVELNKFRP